MSDKSDMQPERKDEAKVDSLACDEESGARKKGLVFFFVSLVAAGLFFFLFLELGDESLNFKISRSERPVEDDSDLDSESTTSALGLDEGVSGTGVSIEQSKVDSSDAKRDNLPGISHLNDGGHDWLVIDLSSLDGNSLAVLAEYLDAPRLIINGGSILEGEGLQYLVDSRVRELRFSHVLLSDESLAKLPVLDSLERLEIKASDRLTGTGFAHLVSQGNLRHIALDRMPALSDEFFEAIKELQSLESLTISDCNGLPTEKLWRLADLPKLSHLELEGLKGLAESKLTGISDCKSLQVLSLRNSPVDSRIVDELKKVKNLRIIDLSGTRVDAASKNELKSTLTNLTDIIGDS